MEKMYLDRHRRSLTDQTSVSNGKKREAQYDGLGEPSWTMFSNGHEAMHEPPLKSPWGLGGHAPFRLLPHGKKKLQPIFRGSCVVNFGVNETSTRFSNYEGAQQM